MVDRTTPRSSVLDQLEVASADLDDAPIGVVGDERFPDQGASLGGPVQIKLCSGEATILEIGGGTAVLNDAFIKSASHKLVSVESDCLTLECPAFISHLSIPAAGCDDRSVAETGRESILPGGGDA